MTTLFLISNIVILSGMLLYIYYMTKNKIDLNLSTRSIWIFLEIIDVISYLNIVEDGIKGLMAVISLASVVTLTIIAAKKGKFKKINLFDKSLLSIGIFTIIIGLISNSYIVTNILLQVAFILAYIPTIKGIYNQNLNENFYPRLISSIGIAMSIVGLSIYYDGRYTLVYPSARLLGNLSIVITILFTQKHKGKNT